MTSYCDHTTNEDVVCNLGEIISLFVTETNDDFSFILFFRHLKVKIDVTIHFLVIFTV